MPAGTKRCSADLTNRGENKATGRSMLELVHDDAAHPSPPQDKQIASLGCTNGYKISEALTIHQKKRLRVKLPDTSIPSTPRILPASCLHVRDIGHRPHLQASDP
jgi:hypothetical protein